MTSILLKNPDIYAIQCYDVLKESASVLDMK